MTTSSSALRAGILLDISTIHLNIATCASVGDVEMVAQLLVIRDEAVRCLERFDALTPDPETDRYSCKKRWWSR